MLGTAALALGACGGGARGQIPGDGLAGQAAGAGIHFGTAVQGKLLADDPAYAAQVLADAALLVPEYEGKWAALQPQENEFDLAPLQQVLGFAARHGRSVRGHTLVWHKDLPDWVVAALREGPQRARGLLEAHIGRVLAETRGSIRDWDVVNEAVANPRGSQFTEATPARGDLRETPWLRALGPDYIPLAFRLAREADPGLQLTYNDYGVEGDTQWAAEKRARVLRLLRRLQDAQVPATALGIQGHLMVDEPFRPEPVFDFIRTVRAMGMEVLITELDVREARNLPEGLAARDAAVAERTFAFLDAVFDAGARTLLCWGLSDRDSWLVRDNAVARTDGRQHRGHPLDAEGRRKPMWQAIARAFGTRT